MATVHGDVSDRHRRLHEEYMEGMTTPYNADNKLLHQYWQPWAERYSFYGTKDYQVLCRESDLRKSLGESSGDDNEDNMQNAVQTLSSMQLRWNLVGLYSFAIPNEMALSKIAELSPVLEVGSGLGYWAYLLRKKGADVVAVDNKSEHDTSATFHIEDTHFIDGVKYLVDNNGCSDKTLLLCWPRHADEMLKIFTGRHLVIVGEPAPEGCTWGIDSCDEEFQEWELREIIDIPTWACIRDDLRVYVRRS